MSATAQSASRIELAWQASTDNVGVAGYRVFRNGVQVASVSATAYSDTGLAASTTYSYRVAAYDAAGNVSDQSVAVSATTPPAGGDTTAPSTPAGLRAATDNVAVAGYRVYRDGVLIGSATGTGYTDTNLTAQTTYRYAVSAFDAAGNEGARSGALAVTTLSEGGRLRGQRLLVSYLQRQLCRPGGRPAAHLRRDARA